MYVVESRVTSNSTYVIEAQRYHKYCDGHNSYSFRFTTVKQADVFKAAVCASISEMRRADATIESHVVARTEPPLPGHVVYEIPAIKLPDHLKSHKFVIMCRSVTVSEYVVNSWMPYANGQVFW